MYLSEFNASTMEGKSYMRHIENASFCLTTVLGLCADVGSQIMAKASGRSLRIVGLDVNAAIRHHLLMETSFGWCQVRRHGVEPLGVLPAVRAV